MSKARASGFQTSGSIGQSPLIRTLSHWSRGSARPPKGVFSSRLAELIDISSAIELSDFFKLLKRVKRNTDRNETNVVELYWRQRSEMLAVIDQSFQPVASVDDAETVNTSVKTFTLPEVEVSWLTDTEAFTPWQRFYGLQQSEMERRVGALRSAVLNQLTGHSDPLAQVAAIERALDPIIVSYSRRCLSVIPKILAKRFEEHRQYQLDLDTRTGVVSDVASWLASSGWLLRFHSDTQHLLKAELALRLQPVEGLIVALGYELMSQDSP